MDFKKVIFMCDLDGTLLADDKKILPKDMEAIKRFRRKGGLFTAATGRGIAMANRVLGILEPDIPAVLFNGAAVYDFSREKFLWHGEIGSHAREYINYITERFPEVAVEILTEDTFYVPIINEEEQRHLDMGGIIPDRRPLSEIPDGGWLKFLFIGKPDIIDKVEKTVHDCGFNDAQWVRSDSIFCECLPYGVDKSRGFAELIRILNAEDKFSVAAGDYMNDLAMIKKARLGVAVGNALQPVKEAADLVVCDNNSGAVSEIIDYIEKL